MDNDESSEELELLRTMMTEMQYIFDRKVADLKLSIDELQDIAAKWSSNELFKETGLPWFANSCIVNMRMVSDEREIEDAIVEIVDRLSADPKPSGQA